MLSTLISRKLKAEEDFSAKHYSINITGISFLQIFTYMQPYALARDSYFKNKAKYKTQLLHLTQKDHAVGNLWIARGFEVDDSRVW